MRSFKTVRQNRIRRSLILLLCILAAQALVSCDLLGGGSKIDLKAFAGAMQSSFDYKLYHKSSNYRKAFEDKMSESYDIMSSYMDDDRTMPIPGSIATYIKGEDKRSIQYDYVPQGLCKAEHYFLVTAYDGDSEYNSVVYVVDTDQNDIVSTLTLPNRYHAGGITYDGQRIWLTGNTSDKYEGEPFLQYIDYTDFEKMIQRPLHRITKDEMSRRVYIKNKPSFLEYSNGTVWVGTYVASKNTERGYINGYPIVEDEKSGKASLDTMMYYVINGIDSSAQGAAIFGNFLYVSSSYMGWLSRAKTSFVTMYDIGKLLKGGSHINVSGKEIRRIEVPKMNEEIIVDQGILYINFESAYDGWPAPVIRTDRIMAVRRNLWR